VRGSPIRKSSDQRSVGSSPRLIAASYVLHRLLVPRHPPCALNNLATQNLQTTNPHHTPHHPPKGAARRQARIRELLKMLASTVQFSTNDQPPPTPPHQTLEPPQGRSGMRRGRPWHEGRPTPHRRTSDQAARSFRTQQRAYNHPTPSPAPFHTPTNEGRTRHRQQPAAELVSVPPSSTIQTTRDTPKAEAPSRSGMALHRQAELAGELLLRKEVIQPHLPVRLPCYDFVPIADPAFDGSLPQGVGPPASGVTDFRDVTGGVYKARERIHRSVADLRLLATPTSWGRVADPNPN
jgi:hypothetical protein